MALDGAFLYVVANEIRQTLLNARVDKISQPSREEIVVTMRFKGGSRKLFFSANANSPRLHFTGLSLENPQTPPMFCMLLRKHLNAGKLTDVRQPGLDRILILDFETVNELGDLTTMHLITEIMGRHSNIILTDESNRIVDSIKRVTSEVSSVRLVLPGVSYEQPPGQDKLNLLDTDIRDIMRRFISEKNVDVSKAIMASLQGISPILARELAYRALKGQDIVKDSLSDFYKNRLAEEISELKERLKSGPVECTAVIDDAQKLRDFTMMDITQYGGFVQKRFYSSASELLDSFYADRDRTSRMKQRSHDLLKLLVNATERITKKLAVQKEELARCANREELKIKGDLINSNLYRLNKGERSVALSNFYAEGNPEVTIDLDPRLTPAQNAQKYYSEYRKAATAEDKLKELMASSEQELIYLDSVFDAVSRTDGESELLEIREELAEQGYVRSVRQKNRSRKPQPPLQYRSSDGFSILCGRNNKQNDQLTLKTARKTDLWLHTQGIAGSHVIVEAEGKEIPDRTVTEAAMIAAYNSKAQDSNKVAVDYTQVKNVKKPSGAKPGMVIFVDYQTAYVTPDREQIDKLAVDAKGR